MHYLAKKISIILLLAFASMLLSLASMPVVGKSVSAQQLETAAECGAGINLEVSSDCTIEKQIQKCKANTPGDEQQKKDACNPESSIEKLIKTILNVFSAIVGSICVIMIIIGGFRYVTSAGDSNNVSGAKNTILYAIVGLIIVAFAQVIVRFVLQRIG